MRRWLLLSLAPLLACGDVLYDQSQRRLFLEPVSRVNFDVDNGGVEVYAFARNAVTLLFYYRGADSQTEDVEAVMNGDEIDAFIKCAPNPSQCIADFYVEVPLGTEISATTLAGGLKLTGVDADVTATIGGDVEGYDLRVPDLDLDVTGGSVTLTYVDPPTSVSIELDVGAVDLTLPAGAYRCDLDAADGEVNMTGVTCDDAATSSLAISVGSGDINLQVAL